MGKKVGFTGTSRGASKTQLEELEAKLAKLKEEGFDEFHHGLCIGADEQAAAIAKKLGYRVVAHPGLASDPKNLRYRSEFTGNDEMREPKPFLQRDRDMVDETERMLATPVSRTEEIRSGTWTTVRYARTKNRIIDLILPPFVPPKWASGPSTKTNAIAGDDPKALIKRGVK